MKHLLLAPFLLGFISPVFADLGEAETTTDKQTSFDLWCGERGNDCKVTFDGERLKVNNGKGITADQILFTQRDNIPDFWNGVIFSYKITYKKNNGDNAYGKFLIMHRPTNEQFNDKLSAFIGKPVGGTDPATTAAKQAADAQKSQQMMQGVQMMKQGMGY
tara:strand:- start:101 stop:583 length:483 start_codon:yes stop_codon:yes gene_type:complete